MTKSVLCAVDISNGAVDQVVVQKAHRLAQVDGAQLDVITVVPDFGLSIVGSFFEKGHHDQAISRSKELLNSLVTDAIGEEANATTRHLVSTGNAYEEILKAAKAGNAELIVIGAHKPDLKDYLLGPNAARVVRHSDCSVFVVR